ncbi:hypothetical protein LTR04_000882 [Oleoguttula sp. CCFEE 6159]|nr:hypothetical protein LTR04_000882 [Oleoguttula sp. CCFEE 6159]
MRTSFALLSALAAIAAAAPAPQMLDFGAVLGAPAPSATGPPVGVSNDTAVYNPASAAAAATSAVVAVETASVTGAAASAAASISAPARLKLAKRKDGNNEGSTSTSTSTTKSSSQSSSSFASSATSITASIKTVSGTATTSSTSACPTVPEAGTYCGFINPEDPCAIQPDGYGPKVTPDTTGAFLAYPDFHTIAKNAKTPKGYVNTFTDLNAAVNANSYLGLHTLSTYDTLGCSQLCDNTTLCTAFNIYIERDPSLNPTVGQCDNPSSITNYKCTLWGSGVDAAAAVNAGQTRASFVVVITGSNGYAKTNNTISARCAGYDAPKKCAGAINAPSYNLGAKFFPGPYDPSVCAAYATAQTAYNKAHKDSSSSSYVPCNMFNAYMVKKNSIAQGTYCTLYDTPLDSSWGSYKGGWAGQDYFSIETSWTYSLSEQKSGTDE